jgi:hypothetical protein
LDISFDMKFSTSWLWNRACSMSHLFVRWFGMLPCHKEHMQCVR